MFVQLLLFVLSSVNSLCERLPTEFDVYLNYTNSLTFEEEPDYTNLMQIIRSLLQSMTMIHPIYILKIRLSWKWFSTRTTKGIKQPSKWFYLINYFLFRFLVGTVVPSLCYLLSEFNTTITANKRLFIGMQHNVLWQIVGPFESIVAHSTLEWYFLRMTL